MNYVHDRTDHHCIRLVVILTFPFHCENNTRENFVEVGGQGSTIEFLWLCASTIKFSWLYAYGVKNIAIQVWGPIPVWWCPCAYCMVILRVWVLTYMLYHILASVSGKCPGFCKCLRFLKSGFAAFSNSAGHKERPALSVSDRRSMMVMATTIKSILTLMLTSTL